MYKWLKPQQLYTSVHIKTLKIERTILRTTKQVKHKQVNSGEPDLQIVDIPHTKTVENKYKTSTIQKSGCHWNERELPSICFVKGEFKTTS